VKAPDECGVEQPKNRRKRLRNDFKNPTIAILQYDFSFPFGQAKRKLKSQEADGHELDHSIPCPTLPMQWQEHAPFSVSKIMDYTESLPLFLNTTAMTKNVLQLDPSQNYLFSENDRPSHQKNLQKTTK
jgi:hypothetical protein